MGKFWVAHGGGKMYCVSGPPCCNYAAFRLTRADSPFHDAELDEVSTILNYILNSVQERHPERQLHACSVPGGLLLSYLIPETPNLDEGDLAANLLKATDDETRIEEGLGLAPQA